MSSSALKAQRKGLRTAFTAARNAFNKEHAKEGRNAVLLTISFKNLEDKATRLFPIDADISKTKLDETIRVDDEAELTPDLLKAIETEESYRESIVMLRLFMSFT